MPPKQFSVRIDGQHEPHTDTKQSEQHEQTNWISGIITCLKPVWSFIGRAALEEKLKGIMSVSRLIRIGADGKPGHIIKIVPGIMQSI